MSALDDFLASSERLAARGTIQQLAATPARGVAVLTCMDARIDVFRVLDLRAGDAHVIRNAGGRASDDAIRSLIITSTLFETREVVVMHHTDCGMRTFTNAELRSRVARAVGSDASDIDFLPFTDLDQSVRDDVRRIEQSAHLHADTLVNGCVYDLNSGQLRQVDR